MQMEQAQQHGLIHWMLFAATDEVFAYNLVEGGGKAVSLLDGLTGVSHIAVDANHGYLFVASQPSH